MMTELFASPWMRWFVRILLACVLLVSVRFIESPLSLAQSGMMSFGYDRGVQVVDPDGLNQVPFWLDAPHASVQFKLYGLDPQTFISRYRSTSPWQPQDIDVSGLPEVATWHQTFPGDSIWDMQPVTLPTATVASGIYVIEASLPSGGQARTFITVGRNVLLLKQGANSEITVWATRLQNAAPVSGMEITLYDAEANALATATTNGDGIAAFGPTGGLPFMVIGRVNTDNGAEVTLAGLDWQWRHFGASWQEPSLDQNRYAIYIHTDRPIYRPGHTVHYNAIVYNNLPGGYTPISTSQPIAVTLRDVRNNVVATQVKTADNFGALDGAFALGAEPPLGDYQVEINVDGQVQTQRLCVEEYRKPEYEVHITTPAPFAISGDAIPITVAADYFFGQPVANAAVTLQIYREPLWEHNYWWWRGHDAPPSPSGLVTELTGLTDGQGRWQTDFAPEILEQYSARYSLKATVTDARNLPVQNETSLPVYWNTFRLGVSTGRYGYRANEPVTVAVTASSHEDLPVQGQFVQVRIVRDDWERGDATDIVPPQSVTTDAKGEAQATFASLPQGWYRIIAGGSDGRDRPVESYSYLWVYDNAVQDWWHWNNDDLSITADKDSYEPGEVATLLIQSRVSGIALVTLERAGLHDEMIVPINGPVTTVEAPVTADFAPNIFATVHLFKRTPDSDSSPRREGSLLTAQTELIVPATEKRLSLTVATDAAQYRPADEALLTLQVADAAGQPVRARISLAVVDEAIFALQPDLSIALFDAFYGRQSNSTAIYDSLVRNPAFYGIITEGPPADPLATPTPAPTQASDGAQFAGPRRLFLDTAFWDPAILTDEQGAATVTIRLPDNLTTWRIIARAITVDAKVGEAQSQMLVTQEVIARPALPRFAILGDRFQAGIVTQNFSGADTTGDASFTSEHAMILEPAAQPVSLVDGGSDTTYWTAVAAHSGSGLVTATVTTGAGQDIVELPLVTKPFAAPDRWSTSGQVAAEASATFTMPFNAVHEGSRLTLHLAPSIASGVLDGLAELIDYPYGCVEQIMSRLLPSAVAAKAFADLGIPNPRENDLPEIMRQGVQLLYGLQHQDGSWGWFYDDNGGAYVTSYVLLGLHTIQQTGYAVDKNVVDRGFAYLDSIIEGVQEPGGKAFALYVKASAGNRINSRDLAMAQALVAQRSQMDASGLAALALALHLSGDSANAQVVIDTLISQARETAQWASWPVDDARWEWYHWQTMSSTEKNTAFALVALLALRAEHPLLPKAVRWLMDHRNGAGWGGYGSANTQATAFAVLGLTEFIRIAGELAPDYTYVVQLNGETIAGGAVSPDTARQPIDPIVIAGADLRPGANTLRIRRSGSEGQLYYSAQLHRQLFHDDFAPVMSMDQGLSLRRSYRLVEGAPRADNAYNIGDVVEVMLEVEASERMSYVLVEDPIPAGFAALHERINPYAWGHCPTCTAPDPFFWPEWGYNRKDIRDDKVDFFISELWPGKHLLTYLMRASTAGEFSVLPAQAYPMYNDEIWGRSSSQRVMVAPERLASRPLLAGDIDRDCRISVFDVRQVAGAYGALVVERNVVGDQMIRLEDVAAVAMRSGASCLADIALPGTGAGVAAFSLTASSQQVYVGETFHVVIAVNAAPVASTGEPNLGGFGLVLHFDPHKVGVIGVQLPETATNATPVGPAIDNASGTVAFGAMSPATGIIWGDTLATITLIGRGVGDTALTALTAEAVDQDGRTLQAEAQTGVAVLRIEGQQIFLPVTGR